jgi:predicted secreted protein
MTYQVFVNDGIELVVDEEGEVWYPGYNSLARVCSLGLAKPIHPFQVQRTVESLLETITLLPIKDAEICTRQGLRTITLLPRALGNEVIKKYNPDLLMRMADLGSLVFLHQLCGFKIESKLPQQAEPQPQPAAMQLPPADVRVVQLVEALGKLGIPLDNPRYRQYIQDAGMNILIPPTANQLPSSDQPRWLGVAERAEELGYQPYLVHCQRSQLGKYVAKQGLESTQEKRLCNGTMRDIYLYPVTDELDAAIRAYFTKLQID